MAQDPLARDQRSSLGIACSALTLDHPHLPTEVTKSIGQGLMGTTWNCCLLEFLRPSKGRGQTSHQGELWPGDLLSPTYF